jgi:hypothetical protein
MEKIREMQERGRRAASENPWAVDYDGEKAKKGASGKAEGE